MVLIRGAEATIYLDKNLGEVIKKRLPKRYRVKTLDDAIVEERTKTEAKIISDARRAGVPTPIILDLKDDEIKMEFIKGETLRDMVDEQMMEKAGEIVGKLHRGKIAHGDLTTSNMIYSSEDRIYLIDFGLSRYDTETEARGVDIHVLFQMLKSTYNDHEELKNSFIKGYKKNFGEDEANSVLKRVEEIERRGRYK
ncbi:MAG: Kae1-associated kinase Bud32 [Candidatus Methanolliviera hydrocarbonicum]|uniref:non-specific serine/threonine protein kinase n=1 Tax=Candidatus Methanolliviera hydrocarbonicum TaxID=2491085 RepID=A0A520KXJ6_9EURY|nr:MAG: Kae1-associated kinase Bud32 [Candidatus Methanolliviera hydrocarbonicum]